MRNDAESLPANDWNYADDPAVRELAHELVPAFYEDLRQLARRERNKVGPAPTMQTTALVHEAYLKLRNARTWSDDRHFFCAAALAMRHALINHAKARVSDKRGGGAEHISLTQSDALDIDGDESLLALDDALITLSQQQPRLARVVECRYFGGYNEMETASALGISERTVQRDWMLAKAWLFRELAA